MRRLKLQMQITADGVVAGPESSNIGNRTPTSRCHPGSPVTELIISRMTASAAVVRQKSGNPWNQ